MFGDNIKVEAFDSFVVMTKAESNISDFTHIKHANKQMYVLVGMLTSLFTHFLHQSSTCRLKFFATETRSSEFRRYRLMETFS